MIGWIRRKIECRKRTAYLKEHLETGTLIRVPTKDGRCGLCEIYSRSRDVAAIAPTGFSRMDSWNQFATLVGGLHEVVEIRELARSGAEIVTEAEVAVIQAEDAMKRAREGAK